MVPPELRPNWFRNEGLFTDHYLFDVLPTRPELWRSEGLGAVREALEVLWLEQAPRVATYEESQLGEHFIRPVLRILGHEWEVQPRAGEGQPDYAFFADEKARLAALPADGRREYWAQALAVGDAKRWERKLDRALPGSGWDRPNPSLQIYYYLAESGARWAILTNGRQWRLYAGEPKPDMQVFYEVDLPGLLADERPNALLYLWLLFRREAFLPGPDGKSFLDHVRAESDLAAARLREDVKDRVYRALLTTCRGFMEHEPNGLSDEHLREVYDNSLVLLYRLLFMLYAEVAELLPLRENRQYRDGYSLYDLKTTIAAEGDLFQDGVTGLWHSLRDRFRIIDAGHEKMGIPPYNGGLFDPMKHPFLEHYALSERCVAQVVDLLARTDKGQFVDYRDLGVRHLGSIYEGLLEYRLRRAEKPMVVIRRNGKDLWTPESEAPKAKASAERCPAGGLYLVTDRGERKATGSYYTPQYIVEYLVENTLGPLADECASGEDLLKLTVLDPAMGSGHFLVEATEFLARRLVAVATPLRWGVSVWGLGRWGDEGDEGGDEEADLARARRLVVERCIYGVDLNPLAVELAKLSLWLKTVAKGEPLSFLDHHLRCGNSLIGARTEHLPAPPEARPRRSRREQKAEEAGQLVLFDYDEFRRHADRLVLGLGEISHTLSDTLEAVQHKGEVLEALEESDRRPYREIADLWCSRYFGNDYDLATYSELVQHLQPTGDGLSEAAEAALERSRALARRHRFFHWELEFPEVFFDEEGRKKDDPGFDLVVGNPPWVLEADPDVKATYRQLFGGEGKVDTYRLFMPRALDLLRTGGGHGFVVPNTFLSIPAARPLRERLLRTTHLTSIATLPFPAFPEVQANVVAYTLRLGDAPPRKAVTRLAALRPEGRWPIGAVLQGVWLANPRMVISFESDPLLARRIADRIEGHSTSLGLLFEYVLGLQVYHNTVHSEEEMTQRVFHSPRRLDERYRLEVGGSAVRPYWCPPEGAEWVLITERCYSCPPTRFFAGSRLVLREIPRERRLVAGLAAEPFYTNKSTIVVRSDGRSPYSVLFAACLLNSTAMGYHFRQRCAKSAQDLFPRVTLTYVKELPIRLIDFAHATDPAEKERLLAEAQEAVEAGDYALPLALAEQALAAHALLFGPAGKADLKEDGYWRAVAASAEAAFPGREDFVHDLLAALAQRMTDLNQRKRAETDTFLKWLEWYMGCPVDDLVGKTKVRAFYEHETNAILDVLAGNKRRLGKPLTATVAADIRREHEGAVAALRPVLAALERTDDLIDEIVYRLYGLTEEEREVVRGTAG